MSVKDFPCPVFHCPDFCGIFVTDCRSKASPKLDGECRAGVPLKLYFRFRRRCALQDARSKFSELVSAACAGPPPPKKWPLGEECLPSLSFLLIYRDISSFAQAEE